MASQFNTPETSGQTFHLESLSRTAERIFLDDLVFYVSNDETHLYVLVDFMSSRRYQHAREFGFTLYIDGSNSVKRSFGVTYPTGIYYQLGNYPGAQQGYLDEPNWSNFPENRSIKEAAERSSRQNALLVQRTSRRDPMQPFPFPLAQLSAQNLMLHLDDDERTGRISFAIPLQTRSTSQFAPDITPGETVRVGFEIDPIRLLDMDMPGTAPLITSETASGRTRTDDDQEDRERINRLLRRMGDPYEQWAEVTLATPSE
ncbi:MAG: hypothetical protein EA363_03280 [Balneolaceae bacterium]|nr:MAG: hypothetical protein EA363_03280 [Balneolaceae bacterium]